MIPSAANSDYPKFVPDQVLTSDNLNDLFGYLHEQERITRTNLLGIGIVCGLQVKTGVDGDGRFLIITKGTGITSQGYLVAIPEIKFYSYNRFDAVQSQFYDPFVTLSSPRSQKFLLWELKQKGDHEPQDNPFHQLNDPGNFLDNKAVMLFVELLETNNKNCDPNSCDDKGVMVTMNFRTLLVLKSDAATLKAKANMGVSASAIDSFPDLAMPRWDVPKTNPVNAGDLASAYKKVLSETFIKDVENSLSNAYHFIQPVIRDEYPVNPFPGFDLNSTFSCLFKGNFTSQQLINIQYYYDFFSDLIEAYNEFCHAGNEVVSVCCPDELLFPRHLLLGEAIPLRYDALSDFRHYFLWSPLFQREDLLVKLKTLFRRLDLMVRNFQIPPAAISGTAADDLMIRITPGKLGDVPLSHKPLPYYYTPDVSPLPLRKNWSLSKKPSQVLAYKTDPEAVDDFVKSPLKYDLEPYNFFRIEGITGKEIAGALTTIKKRIDKYRLPFKVVALATGSPGTATGEDDCCNFSDVEMQFRLLRKAILACLEKNISFWGAYEKKKDDKGNFTLERPSRAEMIRDVYRLNDGRIIVGAKKSPANAATPKPVDMPQIVNKNNTDDATAIMVVKENLLAGAALKASMGNLAGIYVEYQRKGKIDMSHLPSPKTEEPEENLSYYILILLDESEQMAGLLKSEKISDFDFESFISHANKLYDACENIGKLVEAYKATEYLIEKIRLNSGDRGADVDKIAEAMPVMTSADANNIILLLLNLDYRASDFISRMQTSAGKYSAQHSIISEFYDKLDKDGMMIPIIKEPASKNKSKYSKMASHLKKCRCETKIGQLQYLIDRYKEQRDKLQDIGNFSVYLKKHPGIQHKAGVATGGTFLLVYKGAKDPGQEIPVNTVLADFYLPYICASNCTPVDVTIQATPPAENKSPKAVAETSKANITLPGENKVILTGQNSSDPDAGAILTYSWSLEAGSSGAVIDTPAAVTSQVNFSKTGLYVFKLTVTDNKLATATDKVFILVNESPNQIPVARAFSDKGNLEFVKGKEVVATLHGENSEDPEGKPLEYKWSLQGNTGTVSIAKEKAPITAVKFTEPGSYLFTLTVTDNKHASANDYVLVTVREKSKEVKCAPLSEIVQQFYNLGDVDGEGVLSTFKEKYKDYFRVKEFYDSLQKQKIPTLPVPEQVAFFTGSSVADFVESWISDLTKIITENKELRLLALSMLNIHAQLAYYIACIQDKDINQAEAPMETALSVLSRVLYSIADVASDFSQPQKNALIELLTLTRNEKERVVQKLEDKQKPVFMLLLTRIFDELDSWNL